MTYPVPIRLAPDLDPADAVHVPRWLDELREVVWRAASRPWLSGASLCEERFAGNDAMWLAANHSETPNSSAGPDGAEVGGG